MTTANQEQETQKMMAFANQVGNQKEILIDGTKYTVVRSGRYTVHLRGVKGASYNICLCPKAKVLGAMRTMQVFQMLDGRGRDKGTFVYDGIKGTKVN